MWVTVFFVHNYERIRGVRSIIYVKIIIHILNVEIEVSDGEAYISDISDLCTFNV